MIEIEALAWMSAIDMHVLVKPETKIPSWFNNWCNQQFCGYSIHLPFSLRAGSRAVTERIVTVVCEN